MPVACLTAEEVNYLVYRYLVESGFEHSAFVFDSESSATHMGLDTSIPAGLVSPRLALPPPPPPRPPPLLCGCLPTVISRRRFSDVHPEGSAVPGAGSSRGWQGEHKPEQPKKSRKRARHSPPPEESDESEESVAPKAKPKPKSKARQRSKPEAKAVSKDEVVRLRGHSSEVFVSSWNPAGTVVASGSSDATVRLWKVGDGARKADRSVIEDSIVLTHESEGTSTKDVTTMDWSPDGKLLATGSYDFKARLWTCAGGLSKVLQRHTGAVFSLKWNPEGKYILTGSVDTSAIVWDKMTGTVKRRFTYHEEPVLDVDWRTNDTFATCSIDKSICIGRLSGSMTQPVARLHGHTDEVNAVRWSGDLLASGSDDCSVRIWEPDQPEPLRHTLRGHDKAIYAVRWSPPSSHVRRLASASADAKVHIWDPETGTAVVTFTEHTEPVYSVGFCRNGEYVASGSFDRQVLIWSVKDGSVVRSFEGSSGIFDVSWSPSGSRLAACFTDGDVCVLDFDLNI